MPDLCLKFFLESNFKQQKELLSLFALPNADVILFEPLWYFETYRHQGGDMFCSQCGYRFETSGKFCPECGHAVAGQNTNDEIITFQLSDLRVVYGTATEETLPLSEQESETVRIPKDSELAKTAKSPFDHSRIPNDDDLVPLNCAWAFIKHPGPISEEAVYASSINKKFVGMGMLAGRTYSEIVAIAGPPMTKVAHTGGTNAVWGHTGFLSVWQIALNFDPYGVCIGVYSETHM